MRVLNTVSKIARVVIYTVIAIVLLAAGIILTLYSQWGQNIIRTAVVEKLNSIPGTSVNISEFRLRFPVKLDLAGVCIVQQGDTMVKADTLRANVALLPIFVGKIDVDNARLINGYYGIGNADSAMCLKISAAEIELSPASVSLSPLDISLEDGKLKKAVVDLTIKQDTLPSDTTVAQQDLKIRIKQLQVEDLTYKMSMLPVIDSLGTNIKRGALYDGTIDLLAQQIKLHRFVADTLSAAYIAPDSAQIADNPVPAASAEPATTAPWTITIDTIRATNSEALYTTRGIVPQPGLDFTYIAASDLDLTVTNFYNQATKIDLPIKLHGTERCGITLDATGTFSMDSTAMYFKQFEVATDYTSLSADGMMGVGDLLTDSALPLALNANGYCGMSDLKLMFPAFAPYLAAFPADSRTDIDIDLTGNPSLLRLKEMFVSIPGRINLKAKGDILNVFSERDFGCDLALYGNIVNVKSLVKSLVSPDMGLTVPPMTLAGKVKIHSGDIDAAIGAKTLAGRMTLDAKVNGHTDAYNLALKTDKFPVNAFMPELGVGDVTVNATAKGNGFDFFSDKTNLNAKISLLALEYSGYTYHDIDLNAALHNGDADVDASVEIPDLVADIRAKGNLSGDTYRWSLVAQGDVVDLEALKLSTTPMSITGTIKANAEYTPKTQAINADIVIPELNYKGDELNEFTISNVSAKMRANDTLTQVDIHNRDLVATATVPMRLTDISLRFDSTMVLVDTLISRRTIKVDSIQHALPRFWVNVSAGDDNLINDILQPRDMSIGHLSLVASNDSALSLHSDIIGYVSGATTLDTIALNLSQVGDKMRIIGSVDNVPGNMDNWAHIKADGLLNTDRLSMRIIQQNVQRETGFDLGAMVVLADSTVTARLFPLSPVIGYKKWTVNIDNFLTYNFLNHNIDANLKMKGADSSVQLYTDKPDVHENDSINHIVLNISDIHLQDWISFNPFAPPVTGDLSATMNMHWDGGSYISGVGDVALNNFYYNKRKVSPLNLNLAVETNLQGAVKADAKLLVDGDPTLKLSGVLNEADAQSPFNLDLSVIRFPLATANPFLPEDIVQLSGRLNGEMQVSGDSQHPKLNGYLSFESALVKAAMTNTAYAISDVKIPVINNVITIKDFSIKGANDNPLYINGVVDASTLMSPKIDIALNADNMMIVNTPKASHNAIIYGKAFINLGAKVQGNLNFMDIDVKLGILSGTNVNYVLTETTSELTNSTTEGMVKFVNLNDTAAVAKADTLATDAMLMKINAQLNIEGGTVVTVDLPTGSRDKVQVQPSGYLTYSQNPLSDGRLTGRIDINSGYARYTLPVVGSEKMFTFDPNSYVAFNGELLNPVLNIHAYEKVKTNVTQDGQNSRLVNFEVQVAVTGTLQQMDVAFDLTTDDDLSIANELQSMSAEQRASQAMNMLLYNMYTGPGVSNSNNLTFNPLFSFLESQINNWAANNIKGVELSFGIDQYNQTTNGSTSSTMNYSYQVSKSLFDDRFKIMVGGNYSTDTNADENLAENLINDISFEYFINKQHTMILRLFRHVGYESILEGEITQTGVGFQYRRKLERLVDILPKFIRPKMKKY